MTTIRSTFEQRAWETVSYFSLSGEEMARRAGTSSKFAFGKNSDAFCNFVFGMVVYALDNRAAIENLFGDHGDALVDELRALANMAEKQRFTRDTVIADEGWGRIRQICRACLDVASLDYVDPKRPFVIDELIETQGYR